MYIYTQISLPSLYRSLSCAFHRMLIVILDAATRAKGGNFSWRYFSGPRVSIFTASPLNGRRLFGGKGFQQNYTRVWNFNDRDVTLPANSFSLVQFFKLSRRREHSFHILFLSSFVLLVRVLQVTSFQSASNGTEKGNFSQRQCFLSLDVSTFNVAVFGVIFPRENGGVSGKLNPSVFRFM